MGSRTALIIFYRERDVSYYATILSYEETNNESKYNESLILHRDTRYYRKTGVHGCSSIVY